MLSCWEIKYRRFQKLTVKKKSDAQIYVTDVHLSQLRRALSRNLSFNSNRSENTHNFL